MRENDEIVFSSRSKEFEDLSAMLSLKLIPSSCFSTEPIIKRVCSNISMKMMRLFVLKHEAIFEAKQTDSFAKRDTKVSATHYNVVDMIFMRIATLAI